MVTFSNLAGILRDKSFSKLTESDWDQVMNVHLRGTFKCIKAAWPYFNTQKYGRIINTSSAVGLYGNFGQANYSAAKAGLIALANTLAIEGSRNNIVVNTIAPNAGTAMTATVMPPEMVEALKPEYVAPLVVALCHESNTESGGIYECGSCWVSKVRWQRTKGVGFPVDQKLMPEHIQERWSDITNFDKDPTYPKTTQESFEAVSANFGNVANTSTNNNTNNNSSKVKSNSKSNVQINVEAAKSAKFPQVAYSYSEKDVILYALGVGCKSSELNQIYENSMNFKALPTFGVVPSFTYQIENVEFSKFIPEFNPMMLVHGEQLLIIKKPIPTNGKLIQQGRIVDILDKGKGMSIILQVVSKDIDGNIIFENEFTFYIRGLIY